MHITKIKHIEGDIDALKADLQRTLKLQDAKDVVINQLTRHIIVKVLLRCNLVWRSFLIRSRVITETISSSF